MIAENTQTQMRKGILEYCVLLIISKGEIYASDIISELKSARLLVVEGTLYPLLHDMELNGLLEKEEKNVEGKMRKYYRTTEKGNEVLIKAREKAYELFKEIKKLKWLMQVPQQDPQFFAEPHLVLAQGLKPLKFIGMWMELEHRQFTGRFKADALLLLRRTAPGSRYEVLRRMEALSRGAEVRQGVLFS